LNRKFVFLLTACLALTAQTWGGHILSTDEQRVLKSWLARHPGYRQATDGDCDCAGDIQQMKTGYGGMWKPVRDYHPYIVSGDFNGDGAEDFAVVLIERAKHERTFALIVFNGPFKSETLSPAFFQAGMDLKNSGLFYGPPRPKPYRLGLGPFESDSGALLIPHGRSYQWDDTQEE
jgi:hypothetical protein